MLFRSLIPVPVEWDTALLAADPLAAVADFIQRSAIRLKGFFDAIDVEGEELTAGLESCQQRFAVSAMSESHVRSSFTRLRGEVRESFRDEDRSLLTGRRCSGADQLRDRLWVG